MSEVVHIKVGPDTNHINVIEIRHINVKHIRRHYFMWYLEGLFWM
jgi:hypothetical protein